MRPAGRLVAAAVAAVAAGLLGPGAAAARPPATGPQANGPPATGPQGAPSPAAESPWYLERGTAPRTDPAPDAVQETALRLAKLLRDGGVPGFYDGQFASLAGRTEELTEIIRDPGLNHVLRVMAVMALQEVDDGLHVSQVLDPLVMDPEVEFNADAEAWWRIALPDDPDSVAKLRAMDLSQHARFALAKDGQPARVLEKIRVMEVFVRRRMALLLDPSVRSETTRQSDVVWGRQVVFDIAYHYQQFDDYAHASEWFRMLTDNLPGHRETEMAHYNLACIASLQGRADEAMEHLRAAYAVGFTDVAWMEEDADLKSVRGRPDFVALAAAMRNETPPSAGEAPPVVPATPPASGPPSGPDRGDGPLDPPGASGSERP